MKRHQIIIALMTIIITTGVHGKPGRLEVICGSMFSGKSEELIRRVRRATIAQQTCKTFKHSFDDRYKSCHIVSHNGNTVEAEAHKTVAALAALVEDSSVAVVAIDEVQFFSDELINVILQLIKSGKRIIVAGLDLDFKGEPFGCMPVLMALADSVTKLQAICTECGADAHFSQRLVDGQPARHDDPLILVGAQESYQARCRNCYVLG